MVKKQGELRHFGNMTIKKAKKGKLTSAQEIDLLFHAALAKEPITPGQLSSQMGVSKTIISRLIEQLERKHFIDKQMDAADKRSYVIRVTASGKKEIDNMYNYYLSPLYLLKDKMGHDRFEMLFTLIEEADRILVDNVLPDKN